MKTDEEIRDLIEKLKTTKSDIAEKGGAMLISNAIEMSIINLKWVLEDTENE